MRNPRNTTKSMLAAMLIERMKGIMPRPLSFLWKNRFSRKPAILCLRRRHQITPLYRQDRPYPENISHRQILYRIRISDKGGAQREASAITQVGRRIALLPGLPLIGQTRASQGIPRGPLARPGRLTCACVLPVAPIHDLAASSPLARPAAPLARPAAPPPLPAHGRGDLGDELDDAPRGAAAGIQIGVIDRQAPAGAAAGLHRRLPDLGELPPGQPAGQHDLAGSAACSELAARQDIEVDMQPPARRLRHDV